jgi:hypothetical protein
VEERSQWNAEQDKRDRIYVEKVDDIRDVPQSAPNTRINILAGAVFGAIIGGIIVFFLEWLQSDILRTPADVEKMVGVSVVGTIPAGGEADASGKLRWGLPAWLDSGVLLMFLVGIVIGAGFGALVVGLL